VGFAGLGPGTIVATEALANSELLGPGTLFDSRYRMTFPEGADLTALRAEAMAAVPRHRPALARPPPRRAGRGPLRGPHGVVPGAGRAGRAGGRRRRRVGRGARLSGGQDPVIATLKTLGAEGRTIFLVYFAQIGALTALGVALGLALGAGADRCWRR
jgi:putative ABC transport system permease protein